MQVLNGMRGPHSPQYFSFSLKRNINSFPNPMERKSRAEQIAERSSSHRGTISAVLAPHHAARADDSLSARSIDFAFPTAILNN